MAGAREKLLTASDLASLCEVDLKTIHNWVDRGRIPHFRTPGRHLRFRAADVAEFLRTWGYAVPRELAKASSRSTLVIGTKETQGLVVRTIGEGTVPLRLATHPYDALVLAGIEPPDVYVADVKAIAADIDVIGMLEALHRATPEASFIAVIDDGAAELPPFVAAVARADASKLHSLILPEAAAAAEPANQQQVGLEPPRVAGGGSR
jgi:excisionase family DNA binding protein